MPPKLAVIHTTPLTVELLRELAAGLLPGTEVVNFVDDSVLPQLRDNGGDVSAVEARLVHYARFAEEVGVSAVLSACSSVGEVAGKMQRAVAIPIVRIDEAMAEEAVRRGRRIGVAATLPTTLHPTLALLRAKAAAAGKEVVLEPRCADAAYARLLAGDREGHDSALSEVLSELAAASEVVFPAQASMARVVAALPEAVREKFLSSPRLAMARVAEVMGNEVLRNEVLENQEATR